MPPKRKYIDMVQTREQKQVADAGAADQVLPQEIPTTTSETPFGNENGHIDPLSATSSMIDTENENTTTQSDHRADTQPHGNRATSRNPLSDNRADQDPEGKQTEEIVNADD